MKYATVSGSRSDRAATDPVAAALGADQINLTVSRSGSNQDAARSCGKAIIEATEHFCYYEPDLIILPGDRFEILGAACAAHLLNIPIAHIGGGDVTEGSLDNSMRHAISKMAHIHFASCLQSAHNLLAMGEETWRVKLTGDPAIDDLGTVELYSKEDTLKKLGVSNPFFLVAYQPATLSEDPLAEVDVLITALGRLMYPCVFTPLNNDSYGKQIEQKFVRYCSDTNGTLLEMERTLFLSAIKHCKAMIGNSSAGFYEAPSLKKAFINVGDRQKGRVAADSVINVKAHADSIVVAVASAQQLDCSKVVNPYGDGHAVERICHTLRNLPQRDVLLAKKIGDLEQWFSTQCGSAFIANGPGVLTRRRNLLDGWQNSLTSQSAVN
jgi:GDP/UDP-N,N'-diacetylbacillosamine 2-epimerase (hydrolysing)